MTRRRRARAARRRRRRDRGSPRGDGIADTVLPGRLCARKGIARARARARGRRHRPERRATERGRGRSCPRAEGNLLSRPIACTRRSRRTRSAWRRAKLPATRGSTPSPCSTSGMPTPSPGTSNEPLACSTRRTERSRTSAIDGDRPTCTYVRARIALGARRLRHRRWWSWARAFNSRRSSPIPKLTAALNNFLGARALISRRARRGAARVPVRTSGRRAVRCSCRRHARAARTLLRAAAARQGRSAKGMRKEAHVLARRATRGPSLRTPCTHWARSRRRKTARRRGVVLSRGIRGPRRPVHGWARRPA